MKLAHPLWESPICWKEGLIQTLIIEDPITFRNMAIDLMAQTEGLEGEYILSDGEKILSFSKSAEIIRDLPALNIREKRILGKSHKQLAAWATEEKYMDTAALKTTICAYLQDLISLSPQNISFDADFAIESLFKLLNVRPEIDSDEFLERLLDYMSITCEFRGIDTFFIYHLRAWLTEEELEQFAYECDLRKYHVLLIENTPIEGKRWEHIKWIDKDICEILV